MHQSVFRHQHVETCNSIHQHLETVIPISMGRTLTLWPHGGRPVSLAESLLQLLSLGHSFPPIVFSLLHVAWEILVGCRGTPDFEENHEKKNTTNQYPTTSKSWPSLHYSHCRFIIFRSNMIQPVPSCAGITPIQSYPLEKWPSPWPTAAFQVFRASSLSLPGSGMLQGCNIINCIFNYI